MRMDKGFNTAIRHLLDQTKDRSSTLFTAGSLLIVWEAAGRFFEIQPVILPTPTRILLEIWEQAPKLRAHGLISASEILCGFVLAALCAIPVAFLMGLAPGIRRFASPILAILRPAPLVIFVPLIFVWFGYGIRPEIIIAFVLSFVVITAGIRTGLRSLAPEWPELLATMGASPLQIFMKVQLPASLPAVFSASKSAVTLAVIGTTAGEFAQAEMGLGYLILASAFKMETPMVFAGLTILGLIALVLYAAIALLEFCLIRWHVEMTRQSQHRAVDFLQPDSE